MVRKLFIILGVILFPAIAAGQVVITGADRDDDVAAKPAAETGAADGAKRKDGTAEKPKPAKSDAKKSASSPDDLEVPPPAVQIEGLGSDDDSDAQEEDDSSSTAPIELDDAADPPAKLDDVKSAMEEAIRERLRECIADTQQPTKAGLQGAWIAKEQGVGEVIARPDGVTFSDEMFRNAFESADDPAIKDEIASRRESFQQCIAAVEFELDGRMPVQQLQLSGNLVWFNRNALLRDVTWTETATATTEPVSKK